MLIYEYSFISYKQELTVNVIEVEEKPKSYIDKRYNRRILKSEINVIHSIIGLNNSYKMYSDNRNKEKFFIDEVIKRSEDKIKSLNSNIKKVKNNIDYLKKLKY